ncbi:selenide, water dikinase SelD [Aliiroseovarius marinus]|uniref:selenide, water dikinase SelD n=1 Tax=Aliiroseovarius marinus TaxID=2500159 RepID=UPI003D7C8EA5
MLSQPVLTRDLVFVGGGHAHALALRMWGMNPLPGVRVTLINPGPTAPYSGMLPGHIAGHYTREALDIDLVKLARFAGARLILGAASAIDPVAKTITVAGRGNIAYDLASVDVGIHAQMPDIPGFSEHATGAKPLDLYAARWRDMRARMIAGEVPPQIAVIGGGVAGVELAMAMSHALISGGVSAPHVTVIEAGPQITARTKGAQARLLRAMEQLGVEVRLGAPVTRIDATHVHLAGGASVASHFTVGAAGAFAHGWLPESPLPLTQDGFIKVDPTLAVQGHPDLFAVGDCAHMAHAPRPKAGVFAVRAAPVLLDNLKAAVTGGDLRAFKPQGDYLKLISLGGKDALAEKWGRSLSGPVLWRWKNRIDQKFMDQFRQLPQMTQDAPPQQAAPEAFPTQTLCGACGSKLSPGALAGALSKLPVPTRADVLSLPGDDAAILSVGGEVQVMTTDHLRAFTEDLAVMTRITILHALGDIWAMGAAPQAASLNIILPRMSEALQARSMDEIMTTAHEVLSAEGAALVGGHSTMGVETTLGVTLTGLMPKTRKPVTHAGARPGDVLLLTRPIGSGTLLAAEMQGRAGGDDIASLFEVLCAPQGRVAALLSDHATAMTDVTGFGLAGHLAALCRASETGAVLQAQSIPLFKGALELARAGVRSTLFEANKTAAPIVGPNADPEIAALLHDPQTAGGMLAAVPEAVVETLCAGIEAEGHFIARIGQMTDEAGVIRLQG